MNRIDIVRPDAPALTAHGSYAIGVRTLYLTNPNQVDVRNTPPGGPLKTYDRPLTVEVWYPADTTAEPTPYTATSRDIDITVTLLGRAIRDAQPATTDAPYPLIIISHGYPGNRYLLSHLGENLASKGYVVASIDHTDSLYTDMSAFGCTLYHRPLDQRFVLETLAQESAVTSGSFLAGLVDATNTGIIGYSMGGYGAIITSGAGLSPTIASVISDPPNGLLARHQAGSDTFRADHDERIRATMAFAPWGMEQGFWDAVGLADIQIPLWVVAGEIDDISGYAAGPRAIFEAAINSNRHLLTFKNAHHNVAAPIPLPRELLAAGSSGYDHYTDPVWDTVRMNNIAQHFATAFFGVHLRNETNLRRYLDVATENAHDGVHATDENDIPLPTHTYWPGFPARTAAGLRLEHRARI